MLRDWSRRLDAFGRDRGGNVAVIFSFALLPLLGVVGGAIDFHRASHDTAGLQAAFDAAALAGARQAAQGSAAVQTAARNHLNGTIASELAHYPASITVTDDGKTVRIATRSTMPTAFLGVIGMKTLGIVASSTATSTTIETITSKKPITAQLDPEAGDYNRMYVYCYDDSRRNQSDRGRSQMTAIADNAGTRYTFDMPACKANETFSYRLYNVRNARNASWLWDTAQPGTLVPNNTADPWSDHLSYNYYSDTRLVSGVPVHQFENNVPILETVICDTLAQCRNKSQGGIIPTGTNRTPQQANKACAPGKFIYFGWEDRPPGYGWTDSDYDDIRVVVECPSATTTSKVVVRLVE